MIKGCILPWIHMFGNLHGDYKLCCHTDNFKESQADGSFIGANYGNAQQNPLDVWHNSGYNKVRKDFLNDIVPPQCEHVCYEIERNGQSSHRTRVNTKYEHLAWIQNKTKADGAIKHPPIYLDFRFGNTCNFRCRMCGPEISTSWFKEKHLAAFTSKEQKRPGVDPWTHNDDFWKDMKKIVKYIQVIYFAGGEPFVQDGHYKMLKFLLDNGNKNVELQYNSNLSYRKYKDYDIMDLWSKFKTVNLWPSAEGYKEQCEYSRKGFKWDIFEENVKLFREKIVCVSVTSNIYSIGSGPEFYKWLKQQGITFHITNLISPEFMSTKVLPKEAKQWVTSKYKTFFTSARHYMGQNELGTIFDSLRHMNGRDDSHLLPQLKSFNDKLDMSRDEKFTEVFPEYAEWYRKI